MSEQTKVILTKEGVEKIRDEIIHLELRTSLLQSIPDYERDSETIEKLEYFPKRVEHLKTMLSTTKVL